MKKKISTAGKALVTSDWMAYRPYTVFTQYDGYYLKLANEVFETINDPNCGFKDIFPRETLKQLAVILTSHFEDFINETGVWQALLRKNKAELGYFIPFYDLTEYDADYLNPQDFAYLIWYQFSKIQQKCLVPTSPAILNFAEYCYTFFETRIDEAPVTTFYDNFLTVKPGSSFFEIKKMLHWLAFKNYLLAPGVNIELNEQLNELQSDEESMLSTLGLEKTIYALQNDFLYTKRASWCAMTTSELLAEIFSGKKEISAALLKLSELVSGTFLYKGYDANHYQFQMILSDRLFNVRRESTSLNIKKMIPEASGGIFTLVNWMNEWWVSGVFVGWDYSQHQINDIRKDPGSSNFYGWTEDKQQALLDAEKEVELDFREYFNDDLVIFPSTKAMEEALSAHHKWRAEKINAKRGLKKNLNSSAEVPNDLAAYFENTPPNQELAVYCNPGEGPQISMSIPKIIRFLKAENLTEMESTQLFFSFFRDCEPTLAKKLIAKYSDKNLKYPLHNPPGFMRTHFNYLLRFYNPSGFRKVLPSVRFINSEPS